MLVHGTPYSSFLWRDVAVALSRRGRKVFVFDHLGDGQSDKHAGQDLTLAGQGRNFAELLRRWGLERTSVVACDIGGAIVLGRVLHQRQTRERRDDAAPSLADGRSLSGAM